MKCDKCNKPFSPATSWQRFCSSKCRDDWNNAEKKRAAYAAEVERHEERLADQRLNGNGATGHAGERKERIDLAAIGFVGKPIQRRRLSAA